MWNTHVGKLADEGERVGQFRRLVELLSRTIVFAVPDVLRDGRVKQHGFLGNHPYVATQPLNIEGPDVPAVQLNNATLWSKYEWFSFHRFVCFSV